MKRQAFQRGEIRDENDTIISEGAYGKKTAFANKTNDGILDYIINNFQALFDMISGACVYVDTLPTDGDTAKLYVVKSTGKTYRWDGKQFIFVSESVDGLSAYEIAKQNGFEGTEQEWIKSIVSDTIESAETDASGTLIFTMKSGGKIKTTLRPIVECIKYMNLSQRWAMASDSPDDESDTESEIGKTLSSKSWALASKTYASQSKQSETNAKTSETNAKTSETNANASQTAAANSASAASSSASSASTSATNAKNSQTAAASSASAAKSSQNSAATSETNAKTALVSCQNIQTQVNNGLQSLTSAVKYRGSVTSFSALPAYGQSVGDMYNIKSVGGTDANGTAIRAGDNVVWNGSGWDDQAGTVDLSNYYTKSEMNGAVVSATVSDATLTFIHKDASKSTVTVNNVAHAGRASQDDKGQTIDIADLKSLITTTVNDGITTALQKVFPVGSIYSSLTDSRNPADILGFGTWEALPAGYGLVAQGTATAEDGSTLTFTAGKKSGEFKHQITVGELPKTKVYATYNGDSPITISCTGKGTRVLNVTEFNWSNNNTTENGGNVSISFGSSLYHNNISPSLVAYLWQRTA